MTHPILDHWAKISPHPAPQLFRPRSEAELQRFLRAGRHACLLAGNGSKWWFGGVPRPVACCIDLREFDRLLEYSPGDLTVTVQAGVPFRALCAVLLEKGQTLPVDPPAAADATVGGMVAVGISGTLQPMYGTLRDKVLGMRVIHADGTITRAGGKVVKNVAGYDLCKLYTGSMGTLAGILEVTLRVSPCWENECCFVIPISDCDRAKEIFLSLRAIPVTPAGAVYLQTAGESPLLVVRIHGTERSVGDQLSYLAALCPDGRTESTDVIADAFRRFYQSSSPVWLRSESLLSSITHAARRIESALPVESAMIDFGSRRCHFAAGAARPDQIRGVRKELQALNAALIVEKAPVELKLDIDIWGSTRDDLALAHKIKSMLDPLERFNPGVYVPGI